MPGFCSGTEIHPFLSISGIFEDGYRFLMLLMLFSNLFDVDLRDDFFGSNTWDTQRDLHPSTDHCCCCFRWSCYTLNVQGYIQNFGEVMFKIPQLKETCHLIKVVFFFFSKVHLDPLLKNSLKIPEVGVRSTRIQTSISSTGAHRGAW